MLPGGVFDLERQTPGVVDLFNVLVTIAADTPLAWERVNRELPVRLTPHGDDAYMLLVWERSPAGSRGRTRSTLATYELPAWVLALCDQPDTTPSVIRAEGLRMGIVFPPPSDPAAVRS